jgi:hypothetical protein
VTRIAHVGQVVAELIRLAVVLLLTAAGFAVGDNVDALLEAGDLETTRLVTSVLGALTGYVVGGVTGRALMRGVDTAVQRLERVRPSRWSPVRSVPASGRWSAWWCCCR